MQLLDYIKSARYRHGKDMAPGKTPTSPGGNAEQACLEEGQSKRIWIFMSGLVRESLDPNRLARTGL